MYLRTMAVGVHVFPRFSPPDLWCFCLSCSILNSLGAIAFAYAFSLILLEIQDTLRQPPNTIRTMKRAVDLGVGMSFIFYITVAVAGYLAFGNGG